MRETHINGRVGRRLKDTWHNELRLRERLRQIWLKSVAQVLRIKNQLDGRDCKPDDMALQGELSSITNASDHSLTHERKKLTLSIFSVNFSVRKHHSQWASEHEEVTYFEVQFCTSRITGRR